MDENFDAAGMSPFHERYARAVHGKWRAAGLPCAEDFWTFLTRDFRLALAPLHSQRLRSQEVMAAVDNYSAVIALKRRGGTNWQKEWRFYEFCEQRNISRFMDGFRLSDYEKSEAQRRIEAGEAEKRQADRSDEERAAESRRRFMESPPPDVIIPAGMDLGRAYEIYSSGNAAFLRAGDEFDKYAKDYADTVIVVTQGVGGKDYNVKPAFRAKADAAAEIPF